MKSFDPELLRRLAARYRERARTETKMVHTFLEIAADMEAHAKQQEHADAIIE